MIERLHLGVRQQVAINRDIVDKANETGAGAATHRTADPDRIVINDRRFVGRSAHVPFAIDLFFVQPSGDRFRLAKAIADRDPVPSGPRHESDVAGPPMPMRILFGLVSDMFRCEQKANPRLAFGATKSQGPVLIIARKFSALRAAFADHVKISILGDRLVHVDPGLDRDRVALSEIEIAAGARVGQDEPRTFAVEFYGRIARVEIGKLRWAWSGLVSVNATMRRQFCGFFGTKSPVGDRFDSVISDRLLSIAKG